MTDYGHPLRFGSFISPVSGEARQYLTQARVMLRETFNADGTLFVKSAPRS